MALWSSAETAVKIHMAISIEAAKLAGSDLECLPLRIGNQFCIGMQFYESLERNQSTRNNKYASRVLEKYTHVVLGLNRTDVSDFGEPRSFDKATGHRLHVNKRGIALRLMFWTRLSGIIELANIGAKHELLIATGDHQHTVIARFGN
jgi:hypothetical protein